MISVKRKSLSKILQFIRRQSVIDKLDLIRQILNTDEETDIKILSVLQGQQTKSIEQTIHIDQRADKRKNIWIDADLNTGKEKIYTETDNVSISGAFIRTDKKIAKGQEFTLKLFNHGGDEFDFVAEVVRVTETGIGVRLKTVSPDMKIKFSEFVNKY